MLGNNPAMLLIGSTAGKLRWSMLLMAGQQGEVVYMVTVELLRAR